MGKRLQRCSSSTDVDSTTQNEKESESDGLEQVILKKQKKVEEYDCLFENEDAYRNYARTTLFVKGFDCSLPIADIRRALSKHFSSCGQITRIFVPTECKTGSLLGYAFIDLMDGEKKALALDGSYLGSLKLEVVKSICGIGEVTYPNFKGCERCVPVQRKRFHRHFIQTCGGRVHPRTAMFDSMIAELDQKAEAKKKHS